MKKVLIAALIALAGGVAAHEGVKNPAVLARMDAMKSIGVEMKLLGGMAKGATVFDAKAARSAAAEVARHASETPALFETAATDPRSEALPAIWENFDEFTRLSEEMEQLAAQYAASIEDIDDVRMALQQLGQNCQACHEDFRTAK